MNDTQNHGTTLTDGITRLGLTYLVPETHHSKIITSIMEPSNRKYNFDICMIFFTNKDSPSILVKLIH